MTDTSISEQVLKIRNSDRCQNCGKSNNIRINGQLIPRQREYCNQCSKELKQKYGVGA